MFEDKFEFLWFFCLFLFLFLFFFPQGLESTEFNRSFRDKRRANNHFFSLFLLFFDVTLSGFRSLLLEQRLLLWALNLLKNLSESRTLPWVPQVFLACGVNFRCLPKADTSSALGRSKDLTETGNRARKVSGTQGTRTPETLKNISWTLSNFFHQET